MIRCRHGGLRRLAVVVVFFAVALGVSACAQPPARPRGDAATRGDAAKSKKSAASPLSQTSAPTPVSPNAIRFGLFEADLATGELRKRGRKISLQDQPFRVLTLLVQRPGELVSREEFQKALWPGDTFVEFDEGLNKAIQKLRQALDVGQSSIHRNAPAQGLSFHCSGRSY